MLQIIQTRILSVMSFYYLAFLSIGMAMFGLTTGALLVYFDRLGFGKRSTAENLSWTCVAYALAIGCCFAVQLTSVTIQIKSATFILIWLKLVLLLAIPFVFAGAAISLALTRSPFPINVVYGVDLIGAASGCLGVIFVLNLMDAPSAVFLVAAIAAIAGVCFARTHIGASELNIAALANRTGPMAQPALVAAVLTCISVVNGLTPYGFQPIGGKFGVENRSDFALEQWNSFSRIVAFQSHVSNPFLWGPSPTYRVERPIEQRLLNIDGFAATAMPRFRGDLTSVSFLASDITNLAYSVRNSGRCAVIGVGSGRDLLSAYLSGFRDVTGIEVNPIFVDYLQNPTKLREYAGIADLPGVHFVVDEGRSWLARAPDRFDLIEMSMIDTFAATGAGAFSLSENGLYTVEAWRTFLSALAPSGVLTVSRWHAPDAPVEIGRAVSLASAALLSMNVPRPQRHVFIAGTDHLATIIVSRSPLLPEDIAGLTAASNRLQYSILATPNRPSSIPLIADLLGAGTLVELERRGRNYPLDVTAPTDARPFFFNQMRIDHPADLLVSLKEAVHSGSLVGQASLVVAGNAIALLTLLLLILLSAALVGVVAVWPARASVRRVSRDVVRAGTSYFFLIGLGFMLIEIAFSQRISIFLGHPIYGLGVVLFSIILSTGLGSLLSAVIELKSFRSVQVWVVALVVYVMTLPWSLPVALTATEADGIFVRAVVSMGLIAPAGLLMGFGFPTGMRLVNALDSRATPWFWGVNGAAGVFGSGLAVLLSIAWSIDSTLRLGSACYLLLLPPAGALLNLTKVRSLSVRRPDIKAHAEAALETASRATLVNVLDDDHVNRVSSPGRTHGLTHSANRSEV
jgi:hypothetical protein